MIYWAIEPLSYSTLRTPRTASTLMSEKADTFVLASSRWAERKSWYIRTCELAVSEKAHTFVLSSSRWAKQLIHSHCCWALDERKSWYIRTVELSMSEKTNTFARLSSRWAKKTIRTKIIIYSHCWAPWHWAPGTGRFWAANLTSSLSNSARTPSVNSLIRE